MSLQSKIDQSIKLLRSVRVDGPIEVCYSGGKDSDVILELAKMAGINYRAIYKNTTIDPPGTIAHCKANGVEVMQPKMTFFQLIEKKGFPSRHARFCCEYLKEYKVLDNAIQGIRRCESTARASRYKEPIVCRIYGKKENHVNVILPILEWSDKDVADFIELRGIKCHPLYYDEAGCFDVTRRLGCMGCPLASKRKRILFFQDNPKILRAWINAGLRHYHEDNNKASKCKDPYSSMVAELFYDGFEKFRLTTSGMFGNVDCKQFLEQYFKIEL